MQAIRRLVGEDTSLTLRNGPLAQERTFPDLRSLEAAALESLILGGLHFRDAMDDAYTIGHTVADRAVVRLR